MTNYVLLYTGGTIPQTEEEQGKVMAAWGAWYGKMGEAIVDGGNPFNAAKHVGADGAINDGPATDPMVTGYTVISADSMDAAAAACVGHPHTEYGGTVTVHQTFSM